MCIRDSQSTDEYETHTDTATVAMETPSSTTRQLVQHSTTSVDISTMLAYFTTGIALALFVQNLHSYVLSARYKLLYQN